MRWGKGGGGEAGRGGEGRAGRGSVGRDVWPTRLGRQLGLPEGSRGRPPALRLPAPREPPPPPPPTHPSLPGSRRAPRTPVRSPRRRTILHALSQMRWQPLVVDRARRHLVSPRGRGRPSAGSPGRGGARPARRARQGPVGRRSGGRGRKGRPSPAASGRVSVRGCCRETSGETTTGADRNLQDASWARAARGLFPPGRSCWTGSAGPARRDRGARRDSPSLPGATAARGGARPGPRGGGGGGGGEGGPPQLAPAWLCEARGCTAAGRAARRLGEATARGAGPRPASSSTSGTWSGGDVAQGRAGARPGGAG